ncbi:MAG TPA: CDP-alcohol phosphatidyltransferase family protein [Chitinophagaceae bacterium]|nr:CDP-alcohol phosphatidyltransferase family protein [Chitinophagaceae bacterium]
MISVYTIKPKFQQLLKPLLTGLHKQGVTANQITVSSIILSAVIGAGFWFAGNLTILFLCLPVGLLIRMALNALDGMMAKTYNQQSKKGEVLNEAGDIISDIFIYFPLLKYEHNSLYLIVLFLCLGIVNEFAGLLGKVVSRQRRYDGPMGKSDRAFVISIYGILCFFNVPFHGYTNYIFGVINVLLLLSTFIRIKKSL